MRENVRILLIEDSATYAHSIRETVLEVDGTPVEWLWADHLSAGLERLSEGGIDLILLDLALPDSQGLDTFARVHAHAPDLPIVVSSSLEDESLAAQIIQRGAQDCLVKDWMDGRLLARSIRYALERHGLQAELAARTRALQASEERHRSLLENIHVAIVTHAADGRIVFSNPAACELLGLTEDQMLGREAPDPRWRFLREDGSTLPVEEYPVQQVLATNRPLREAVYGITRPGKGDTVWVLVSADPFRDPQGEIVEVVVTFVDITALRQTEEQLRASEIRFRELFDNMSSGCAVYRAEDDGQDFSFVDFNQAGERIEQMQRDDLVGRRVDEVFPSVKDFGLWDVFQRVWRTGQPEHYPIALYHDERITGWRENYVFKLPSGEVVALSDDVTERKQAEEALRESQAALQKAQQVAHVGSWTWHIPSNRLEWSDEMYRIFGVEQSSFTGDLADVIALAIHPEDRAAVEQSNLSVINDQKPVPLEYRVVWPDGMVRVVWAEAGELVLDKAGAPAILTGIVQDITERKRAEAALRESEERWQFALEGSGDGVWDRDFERGEAFFSPRWKALIGYQDDEISNDMGEWRRRLHPDDQERVYAEYQKCKHGATPLLHVEYRFRCKGGEYRWFLARGKVVARSEDGRALRMIGTHTDITGRKRAEEELRRLYEQTRHDAETKATLLQEVHHRVKNNLQIISSLLDLQANQVHDPGVIHALQNSRHRVRAMALVHESLYQTADLARLDLGRYVQEMAAYLMNAYQGSALVADPHVQVEAVPLGLDQAIPCGLILTELLTNALKHAFPGSRAGEIWITLRRRDEQVKLGVRDDGVGLPADLDPFDSPSLGLRIVQLLTRQLRGTLTVDSTADRGTTFTLTFPVRADPGP